MAKNAAQHIVPDDELDELIDGLRQPEKMISPKYFYDERGSQLFEEITRLPEYYPTETELGIMRDNVGEIAALVGKQASLIEFGSGSSLKTRVLLENLDELAAYVPVDISEDHLLESAQQIREDFPKLDVLPVVAPARPSAISRTTQPTSYCRSCTRKPAPAAHSLSASTCRRILRSSNAPTTTAPA
jgi:uncharacterized SAM-dependent methyltransferase